MSTDASNRRKAAAQDAKEQMSKRRVIYEAGQAQTAADIDLPGWNNIEFFQPRWEQTLKHWYPGAKKKSAQAGEPLVFRMLPALSTMLQGKGGSEQYAAWKPGRDVDGTLFNGMVRQVGVVEGFGSSRQVSFIPTMPYVPDKYAPYSSPHDNPYQLLHNALFQMKSSGIDNNWFPLVMKLDDIKAYRAKHKLDGPVYSASLLPMRKKRFFMYAHIYRGYDNSDYI